MSKTRKVPKARAPAPQKRVDGWENVSTGFGVLGRDKRLGASIAVTAIAQDEAELIWRGDDIAARIVETVPNEMLREGFCITVAQEEKPEKKPGALGAAPFGKGTKPGAPPFGKKEAGEEAPEEKSGNPFAKKDFAGPEDEEPEEPEAEEPAAEEDFPKPTEPKAAGALKEKLKEKKDTKSLSELMDREFRKLDIVEALRTAMYYARAYGGAGIFLGVEDGTRDLAQPLNEEAIKSFEWVSVLTPRELVPERYYSDPRSPKYGQISSYKLVPIHMPPGTTRADMPEVHESRICRVGGISTSRHATMNNVQPGWDDSIFVRLRQIIADFQGAWQGASIIMQDFAPPVLKIKGLAKLLGSSSANATSLAARAQALELCRSIARTAILDSEEEYKRETVPVTGLAEMLEQLCLRLAAAAGMPVSLLMGQAPAGLNATGDSDIRWFYDQVSAMQERVLRPIVMRIARLMLLNKAGPSKGKEPENWDVRFNPLWQLTEAEQANMRKAVAEADAIYITNQVVTPEEVARSRFGGDDYSAETQVDIGLRDQLAAEEEHQAQRLGQPTQQEQEMHEAEVEATKKGAAPAPGQPGASPFPPKKGAAPAGKKPPFPPKG